MMKLKFCVCLVPEASAPLYSFSQMSVTCNSSSSIFFNPKSPVHLDGHVYLVGGFLCIYKYLSFWFRDVVRLFFQTGIGMGISKGICSSPRRCHSISMSIILFLVGLGFKQDLSNNGRDW